MKKLIMLLAAGLALIFVVAISGGSTAVNADATCKAVEGRITSKVFTNGCTSPLGLCTVGKYKGDVKGDFTFVATSFVDNEEQPTVPFTTGVIELTTKKGTLMLLDASAFSPGGANEFPTDFFASVQTIDAEASSGVFGDATGRIRAEGVFQAGCVDCKYRGEICGLDGGDDDDDDD